MSEITPEKVAATPPTPANVAEMLTSGDNDYHDGNEWKPGMSARGNVVHIRITPYTEPSDDINEETVALPDVHFRAVVVEGETVPDLSEMPRLKARLEAAEWCMTQALDALEHEEARHHLARYFAAAEAAQAEKGGTPS
ncbi:hypothetical protein [Nonomuraea sp. NPDC001023]|uniref:hypothetical protein n=1 Tax=unclassified Nonomuraea TaxID=2593643 RepID=UPI00332CED0D